MAPAGVELNGAAAGCHLGEDGPDLFLKVRQGQLHPVAVDVPQGIDDVGQAVVAVWAFLHQRPGVGQGVLHRFAGQARIVGKVGVVQVLSALRADPVVEGAQDKVQLLPALG